MSFLGKIGNWIWNGAKSVAGAVGIGTSGFENDEAQNFQAQQAQMNRQWQESMLQKQMDYQTDMWNKTNKYNSASEQMKRYRDAGLNPYLMMTGGANAGTATSQGSPSGSSAPSLSGGFAGTNYTPAGQLINSIASAKAAKAQERDLNADASLKEIQANYHAQQLIADLEKTRLGNKYQDIINSYQSDILDATHKQILQQANTLESQEQLNRMDVIYKSIQIDNLDNQLKSEIAYTIAKTDFVEKQKEHEIEKIIKTKAESKGIKISNHVAQETADAIIQEARNDAYWSQFTDSKIKLGQSAYHGIRH